MTDGKWILQQINKRLSGQMPDPDWEAFQKLLDTAGRAEEKCPHCNGTGQVITHNKDRVETIYRCCCPQGQKLPELYAPYDKEKKSPLVLKTYRPKSQNPDWDRSPGEWD